ncbi:hypothetical protein NPX13_g7843 [Xylaria arbuscula]|uniref:Uncharacterized protein n=1 Tax=Xylaria arbuscula TaxID=114810 RepID=A0A9W8N9J5_9PEZI|nr:hypothetical protein NPX13_g7843 [Xylaria arbuscula]
MPSTPRPDRGVTCIVMKPRNSACRKPPKSASQAEQLRAPEPGKQAARARIIPFRGKLWRKQGANRAAVDLQYPDHLADMAAALALSETGRRT